MTISNLVTTQPLAPVFLRAESEQRTNSGEQEPLSSSAFAEAWQRAVETADHQAPSLANNLRRLIADTPDALPLYLTNLTAGHQREMTMASATIARAGGSAGGSGLLTNFERVLKQANDGVVSDNQKLLAKYSRYIVALSELMTRINSMVKAENDGKSNINGNDIIDDLAKFAEDHGGETGVLDTFSSESAAKALADRFRGGTVEVFKVSPNRFGVRFALSKLAPIVNAVAGTGSAAEKLISALKRGEPPRRNDLNGNEKGQIRGSGINAHGVQGLSLATGDVQKTHQTDLDLLLNDFSRSISQFDNLVKLYSSLATALTETLKSFL